MRPPRKIYINSFELSWRISGSVTATQHPTHEESELCYTLQNSELKKLSIYAKKKLAWIEKKMDRSEWVNDECGHFDMGYSRAYKEILEKITAMKGE